MPLIDPGEPPLLADASDFIHEVSIEIQRDPAGLSDQVGLVPIANGIFIEHLALGQSIERIWGLMYMVRSIIGLHGIGGQGIHRSAAEPAMYSGFISVPDLDIGTWDRQPLKKLAAMAPGSTLNVVSNGRIDRTFKLQVPPRIYNFPDISCKNKGCVSHPSNMQHEVPAYFVRTGVDEDEKESSALFFACKYCETQHDFWEIWDYKYYNPSEFTL